MHARTHARLHARTHSHSLTHTLARAGLAARGRKGRGGLSPAAKGPSRRTERHFAGSRPAPMIICEFVVVVYANARVLQLA